MQTLLDQPDGDIGVPPGHALRPPAIEPWSNRVLIHPAAEALLAPAIAARISPNMVTLAGLALGLLAALAYTGWAEPLFALL
ncbi:MAG: hypothetical protein ACK4MX_09455, partial [Thermaurantiacus sp.]